MDDEQYNGALQTGCLGQAPEARERGLVKSYLKRRPSEARGLTPQPGILPSGIPNTDCQTQSDSMSNDQYKEREAHLMEVLSALVLPEDEIGPAPTRKEMIARTSAAVVALQGCYEDYCRDLKVDLTSTWVNFVLPGQSPSHPWYHLLEGVTTWVFDLGGAASHPDSHYESKQILERLKKHLGTVEQWVSLAQDTPGLEVKQDLSTRFSEHKEQYKAAWRALSQADRDAVSGRVIAAQRHAEANLETLVKRLQEELSATSISHEVRSTRFEKLIIDKYDLWRSASKSFRDSAFVPLTASSAEGQ